MTKRVRFVKQWTLTTRSDHKALFVQVEIRTPTCPACHHSTDAHGITDVCAVDDCECAGGGL